MALPATDDFTTGSDQALTSYSANWSIYGSQDFYVPAATDDTYCNYNDWTAVYWNADSFDDDQYSEATFTAVTSTSYLLGVAARVTDGGHDSYAQIGRGNRRYLMRLDDNSPTTLASSTSSGYSVSDTLKLECSGTTITPNLNGSEDANLGAQSDSTYSSGSAGLAGYKIDSDMRLDDWEGGDLGAAPGRTTYNTDAAPLGLHTAMGWRVNTP